MDGKINATPTIKESRSYQRMSTVNRYTDRSLLQRHDTPYNYGDQGYAWTEYFKIHWDEIVENPDHYPDDPCSSKYITNPDNLDNERLHEHGNDYKQAWIMQRMHYGAKQGKKTDCEGIEQIVWSKTGEWIFYGESEIVKSVHWLHSEIGDDPDLRLLEASGSVIKQYVANVRWRLNHLTYNGQEFEVVKKDEDWNTWDHKFSAWKPQRTQIEIVTKNTEVYDGPNVEGRSSVFWNKKHDVFLETTVVNIVLSAFLWERKQIVTLPSYYE